MYLLVTLPNTITFLQYLKKRWRRVKVGDARGRLTRFLKYTDMEPKEMIKDCIQHPANTEYKNARSLLEQKYGNPQRIIAAYRREIKTWSQLKLPMVLPFKNSTILFSIVKVQLMAKHGMFLTHQK